MERVDVVVVGGGLTALATARAAAAGGVRTILVTGDSLPAKGDRLYGLSATEVRRIGLKPDSADRVVRRLQVDDHELALLNDEAALYVFPVTKIHRQLHKAAKKVGVELRDGAQVSETQLDPDGWIVSPSQGEPIRAPILVVADGVRSPTLRGLGVATAQHFTPTEAEICTFYCAQFKLPEQEFQQETYRILERGAPMTRYELLPGKKFLTLAFGPVWQSADGERPWPSVEHPATMRALEIACRKLDLPNEPKSVELEEWRLDALPGPATFDGGIVLGAAAGHRIPAPLTAAGNQVRQGEIGGQAAAKAVLEQEWSAAALAHRLGAELDTQISASTACLQMQAHGLREHRDLPDEFWLRGRPAKESIPVPS